MGYFRSRLFDRELLVNHLSKGTTDFLLSIFVAHNKIGGVSFCGYVVDGYCALINTLFGPRLV